MKKNIEFHKVKNVAIAIVPRDDKDELWDCFLINLKDEPLNNVLINSVGYGERNGSRMKTTELRHYFEKVEPENSKQIEPIQSSLFDLTNEFWISFNLSNGYRFDKKYIFVKGSISNMNFTDIPFINRKGVMIL